VGLSGGVDSVVLLDLFWRARTALRVELQAVHVHHGLSPNAADWAGFSRRVAARRGVALRVVKVDVTPFRDKGLEAAAREARYRAFAEAARGYLALAHHADDQAETFLLQLLRGAGSGGLGGMRELRPLSRAQPSIQVVRPLLDVRRAEILAYARRRRLRWIEDESNSDTARLRNAIRHEILPRLERLNSAAVENINRGARLIADTAAIARERAASDLQSAIQGEGLSLRALRGLEEARAVNVLRLFLECNGLQALSSSQTRELWSQLTRGRPDAKVAFSVHGLVVRRYRDSVVCEPEADAAQAVHPDCAWDGSNPWRLEHLRGLVVFRPVHGAGIRSQLLETGHRVEVRGRREVRTFKPVGATHRRVLKKLFQEASIPGWRRAQLPFLYIDETLSWVPGLGVAAECAAAPGEAGLQPEWRPDRAEIRVKIKG
jgi:tRNA(Ile)-lysidine synthase